MLGLGACATTRSRLTEDEDWPGPSTAATATDPKAGHAPRGPSSDDSSFGEEDLLEVGPASPEQEQVETAAEAEEGLEADSDAGDEANESDEQIDFGEEVVEEPIWDDPDDDDDDW